MSVDLGPRLGLLINADIGEQYVDQFRPFLRAIDELLMCAVINSTTTTPPVSPSNGDAYLLLGSPTGAWTGQANSIAIWSTEITQAGSNTKTPGWEFRVPNAGWMVWDTAVSQFKAFYSGAWHVFSFQPTGNYITSLTGGVTATGPGAAVATLAIATVSTIGAVKPDGTTITINGSGVISGAAQLLLQTNGTNNGSQSKLNLKAGSNTTLTDDGTGGITIASTAGGLTPHQLTIAPSVPGNFQIAHGLGKTPSAVTIEMTSGGQVWFQATRYDATNIYFVASDGGLTGFAMAWA